MNEERWDEPKKIKVDVGSPLDQWQPSYLNFYLAVQKYTDAA